MLRGILLLFLLTAGLICPAQKVSRNAAYADLDTGVTFPAVLGSFRKISVGISDNPVVGNRIVYLGGKGTCFATIYIYALAEEPVPITDKELKLHFQAVRQSILDQAKPSKEPASPGALRMTEVESEGKSCFTQGSMLILREKFQAHSEKEETYHTEVVVLRIGDRIVKLRISVPVALTEENRSADDFILAFCRLFCRGKDIVFKPCGKPAEAVKTKK